MKAGERRDIAKAEAQREVSHRWRRGSHIPHAGRGGETGRTEGLAGPLRFRVRQIGLRGCQRTTLRKPSWKGAKMATDTQ